MIPPIGVHHNGQARWPPGHVALCVLVCAALPLGSWLFAGGALAYTMYSSTVAYRLEIVAYDAGDRATPVSPADLVPQVSAHAAPFLQGAYQLREVPQIDALRAHLADLGRIACRHAAAVRVDVVLHEKPPAETAEVIRTARVRCVEAR
jgi:hypothetical protein